MFTDSKYFNYYFQPNGNQIAVWCKPEEQPQRFTLKKPKKVHVYAGLSHHGVTPLFFVQGTSGMRGLDKSVTAAKYTQLLEDCLLPAFENVMSGKERRPLFQQDGAPAHTAALTTHYLESRGIDLLAPWPA